MPKLFKKLALPLFALVITNVSFAQVGGWNPELENESRAAMNSMIEEAPKLQSFYDKAYGYAIFPKVTKAGLAIGGAAGNGIVHKNKAIIGSSKLRQASFGLQAGSSRYPR